MIETDLQLTNMEYLLVSKNRPETTPELKARLIKNISALEISGPVQRMRQRIVLKGLEAL